MTKDRKADLRAVLLQNETEFGSQDCLDTISITMETSDNFMGDLFTEVEKISGTMDHMEDNILQVKRIYDELRSTPSVPDQTKEKLTELMAHIKKLANNVHSNLTSIEYKIQMSSQDEFVTFQCTHDRIWKTQHFALSMRFVQMMTEYNGLQSDYREDCKDRLKRQLEITGRVMSDHDFEQLVQQGNVAVFTQEIILEPHKNERQALADIQARHADIIQLENSIKELYNLFVDMTLFVHCQGVMMDRIEKQVEVSGIRVKDGNEHIHHCEKYKRGQRKRVGTLFTLLMVFVVIFGIGFFLL